MQQIIEIFFKALGALGVVAAIYNIFSIRSHAQDQSQRAKIDQALAQGKENAQEIKHLKEHMDVRERDTDRRLDQIGVDVAFVRDLFTKWLLDPHRKP
ncbi:MAG TPA: hypothetical protein VF690_02970 [Hymenobacter sp.]|jgi:hypothetical protein